MVVVLDIMNPLIFHSNDSSLTLNTKRVESSLGLMAKALSLSLSHESN